MILKRLWDDSDLVYNYNIGSANHLITTYEPQRPRGKSMDNSTDQDIDYDKVDEITLALMYLVTWDRIAEHGSRAWKGFDWATMDRLHKKGLILDPQSKAKSVAMTEDGFR